MDNYQIADAFSLLAKLMDIHGDDPFKSKSYAIAAFQIEKLPAQLASMPPAEAARQKGIGVAIAKKIDELLQTGTLSLLNSYLEKTPAGVIEMLNIKGIGPKKIHTIWKEMGLESIGELQYACQENRLTLYKGFGEKTQANVLQSIAFYLQQQGWYLYQQAEDGMQELLRYFETRLPVHRFEPTGNMRRQMEVTNQIDLLTTASEDEILPCLTELSADATNQSGSEKLIVALPNFPRIVFHFASRHHWFAQLAVTTGGKAVEHHLYETLIGQQLFESEEAVFAAAKLPYIRPMLRDLTDIMAKASQGIMPALIEPGDIRGIVHSHSRWSDGSHTIAEMAEAAIAMGFEYLVISDHSKSAIYANGLNEQRIAQQHEEIDGLNKRFAPFKIFKSIECDILPDGSLDYADEVLAQFDLVIASVHSQLKMSEEKAMQRLLNALSNPYVAILGHMSGRLLLSREGYPLHYPTIFEACAANHTAVELNAHPRRLDVDWRQIPEALQQQLLISINPDAHAVEGFNDCRYGVLAAQKAMVTPSDNLTSRTLPQFENWLQSRNNRFGLGQ